MLIFKRGICFGMLRNHPFIWSLNIIDVTFKISIANSNYILYISKNVWNKTSGI